MSTKTVMERTRKKAAQLVKPAPNLAKEHRAELPRRVDTSTKPSIRLSHNEPMKPSFGHDFNRIGVHSMAEATNQIPQSCPLTMSSPRYCPFGGACHTCPTHIQTKLAVNQPGDQYEQEADRTAKAVVQTPEHHAPVGATDSESAQPSTVPPIVHEALRSPSQPLDPATRAFMESRFGYDFSKVCLHTDAKAADSARTVNALAYTVGQDVVFGAGQYKPLTATGRILLAHELAHTIQQRRSRNIGTNHKIRMGSFDGSYEKSAGSMARRLLELNAAESARADLKMIESGLLLQRKCAVNSNEQFYRNSPNYCKDTGFTGLFHLGETCYREVPRRSSYFECPPGEQVCFDSQGRCDDSSYDKISPVESRNSDGTCNLHGICSLGHGVVDLVPWLLREIGRRQAECLEGCETLPWYSKGFCYRGCTGGPIR